MIHALHHFCGFRAFWRRMPQRRDKNYVEEKYRRKVLTIAWHQRARSRPPTIRRRQACTTPSPPQRYRKPKRVTHQRQAAGRHFRFGAFVGFLISSSISADFFEGIHVAANDESQIIDDEIQHQPECADSSAKFRSLFGFSISRSRENIPPC